MDTAKSLLLLGLVATAGVSADLRKASQPDNKFDVIQRNGGVQLVSKKAYYMEPSTFNYQGLKDQRDGGGYDNFLRSNIDNQQDKRNFNTEAGRDMLPFRNYEGDTTDASATIKNKLPTAAAAVAAFTVTPGKQEIVPLRWNNPHAAELEVNVWIMKNTIVVPVRKPTCAGEGHQDAVFAFKIPEKFNEEVAARVPGFKGCKAVGDCVLQVYAHSVEPRQYASGVPIIITGDVPTATTIPNIESARADPGLDLSKQPDDLCLSSADDAKADIPNAVPRMARLISDVANHAYQNSDYSPYSGQQPEAISRTLQASVIISMIPGNRGELGKELLKKENKAAAALQAGLAAKTQNLKEQYEGVVNNIIAKIGDKTMQANDADGVGPNGIQKTAKAFRGAEVGSTTTERQTTTTYVPSFELPKAQVAAARALVPEKYKNLITADGKVLIYQAVLDAMKGEFNKAALVGLTYQGPVIKTTLTTMDDPKQFKKLDANNKQDGGVYAAKLAETARKAQEQVQTKFDIIDSDLLQLMSSDNPVYPDLSVYGASAAPAYQDMSAWTADRPCDSDVWVTEHPEVDCSKQPLGPVMFQLSADGSTLVTQTLPTQAPGTSTTPAGTSTTSAATTTTVTSTIAAAALSFLAAVFLA